MKSVNPYNQETVFEIDELSDEQINQAIENADNRFSSWRKTSFSERSKLMFAAAEELKKNKREYAETMTLEMGKPIKQAIAEIEKCAWVCEYYAENAENHLSDRHIETDAEQSYVSYEPIGVVLAVMPWNYPYWQVFRFAAPALMAGNIGILKHASNVMHCGEKIQQIFERAGFPEYCFQHLPLNSDKVDGIIKNKKVKAVTLTGSKPAGSAVASKAGSEIKKSVLELGGSNALVVFPDCNMEETLKTTVQARFQNTGQSCIAGKRLLLHESIAEEFTEKYVSAVRDLKSGDPMNEDTYIGTVAREDLAKDLEEQLRKSVDAGAKVLTGGKRDKAYFEPTVVDGVTTDMTLFNEETFGPVIGITRFKTEEEALNLVNISAFGLGVSVFTQDLDRAKKLIPEFDDGAVFINELVKSDPRLPFGGTKISGYGRELSKDGIREFMNLKTVYINKY
ncbi:NAD-dependent succinate-semialdehyde dehydrogenase [Psychroflexus sediminis]|uniref:Succinate-semialdehyde dehydrogenase / glutarate-semialdehyde dehydrogenase n=1 Tax=Psychroflexus sediminis TaxID=470826 RepID=A0A1G7WBN8_9FLAO|nr:NAD-dependent succinate-semialdehyde dehydrogenase [Psychroflexus sediminis]SDG69393.1 succinate-semialdehyde dehydrogenase / glutarate-semialdehyde dehydrogenase [Psychroflexus sediminis]